MVGPSARAIVPWPVVRSGYLVGTNGHPYSRFAPDPQERDESVAREQSKL